MPESVKPYASLMVVEQMPEFQSSYPDRFRTLRSAGRWCPTNVSPMLRLLLNLDQSPYLRAGYELGLMPCDHNPNYTRTGAVIFNPDLTLCLINDGARRQGGKIRFTTTLKVDAIDCFLLGKRKVRRTIVSINQLLPTAPPPERGETECPICKSEMGNEPLFTCRNGHQVHMRCWDEWTRTAVRDRTLCVLCRCDTTADPKTHLRTEFHIPAATHRDADLLALSIFKYALDVRGGLMGYAVGDTLYRYTTDHHLTEYRSGDERHPELRGVIISTSIQRPFWRDFITYFRTPENISYLLGMSVPIYHYGEATFLADLNRSNPVDVAMRLLTDNPDGDRRNGLKWRTYLETQILTKSNDELIDFVKRIMNDTKDSRDTYHFGRESYDLPYVPPDTPARVEVNLDAQTNIA